MELPLELDEGHLTRLDGGRRFSNTCAVVWHLLQNEPGASGGSDTRFGLHLNWTLQFEAADFYSVRRVGWATVIHSGGSVLDR
jgi:hypothetical protein